jgi:hypothetical protein
MIMNRIKRESKYQKISKTKTTDREISSHTPLDFLKQPLMCSCLGNLRSVTSAGIRLLSSDICLKVDEIETQSLLSC